MSSLRTLLERDREVALLDDVIVRARSGAGAAAAIEGPAGIGKTTLLAEACDRGRAGGMAVQRARGGEMERDFPYGVVRQLFESVLRDASPDRRRDLLDGPALLADSVLALGADTVVRHARPGEDPGFDAHHALYWLAVNLAADSPLLLVVDDAHWADVPSLRFLTHLVRRIDGLSIGVVVAGRPGETGEVGRLLAELMAQPAVRRISLPALTPSGLAQMVEGLLGQVPDPAFVAASQEATGGVPFLVGELIGALAADGIGPTRDASTRVAELGPRSVGDATLRRISSVSAEARRLAEAVAVLGASAQLRHAADLADLDPAQALDGLDILVAAQILRFGPPLEFVHPIVRTAVYETQPPGRRAGAHARAARLLAAEGADGDAVAAHLLSSQPVGDGEVTERLRMAAARAAGRGAPHTAVVYLARAAAEGVDRATYAATVHELAVAEKALMRPSAIGHFQDAMAAADDPRQKGRSAIELAELYYLMGRWDSAVAMTRTAAQVLDGRDSEMEVGVELYFAGFTSYDPRYVSEFDLRLPELRRLVEQGGRAARGLAVLLAVAVGLRGADRDEVRSLCDMGLEAGLLDDEGLGSLALPQAMWALKLVDDVERAHQMLDDLERETQAAGSVVGFLAVASVRAGILARRGMLVESEADFRAAWTVAQESGALLGMITLATFAVDTLLERPGLSDVAVEVNALELPGPLRGVIVGSFLFEARGVLRLKAGDTLNGIDDLRACGRIRTSLGYRDPITSVWRRELALAVAAEDRDEALALAHAELDDARAIGLPRGIGAALRTLGLIEGGEPGLEHLDAAVCALATSPARLEHARALVELGAALGRANQRMAARKWLVRGLDLAHRCGATRLVERAKIEVAAVGARPRRLRLFGHDALTPSERRIALMAAEGSTNREIAQALFVTPKTVENHLSGTFRKLGIAGRNDLSTALDQQLPADHLRPAHGQAQD